MRKTKEINQQCAEANALLSKYGFQEEYERRETCGKNEEYRFLYLQLDHSIGLLVYNFCHTKNVGDFQGYDMFVYNTENAKDAIFQFHAHKKSFERPKIGLLSFQNHLDRFKLIIDRLLEEDCDYIAFESQFERLSKESCNRNDFDAESI